MKKQIILAVALFFVDLSWQEQCYPMEQLSKSFKKLKLQWQTNFANYPPLDGETTFSDSLEQCHIAIARNDVKIIEQLINKGVDIKKICDNNRLLYWTLYAKAQDIFKLLLKVGCNTTLELDRALPYTTWIISSQLFDYAWCLDKTRKLATLIMAIRVDELAKIKRDDLLGPYTGLHYDQLFFQQMIPVLARLKNNYLQRQKDAVVLVLASIPQVILDLITQYMDVNVDEDDGMRHYLVDHALDNLDDVLPEVKELKNMHRQRDF